MKCQYLVLLAVVIFSLVAIAPPMPSITIQTPQIPDLGDNYDNIHLPDEFNTNLIQGWDNTPNDNPTTDEGTQLGRVLFYDTNLSQNNAVACASCHLQENSFTDPDAFSTGFLGGLTGRNSMSLANSRFYQNGHFFWDERAATLEEQTLKPIQDGVEMGMHLDTLVNKLSGIAYYPPLFEKAFGSPDIDTVRIARALAQFVRSMVSYQSKFDIGIQQADSLDQDFSNFTAEENLGKSLFLANNTNCQSCHMRSPGGGPPPNEAIFFNNQARNNGLDSALVNADNGVGDVTGNTADNGFFKMPSLRNVALTAPYMHDGRFATLAEVVEHYNSGVQPHPNLDPRMIANGGPNAGNPRQLNLTQVEKDALVAFMHTLTDSTFITDERWSDPFVGGVPVLNTQNSTYNYDLIHLPDHFLNDRIEGWDNTPNNNEITDEGALLGRTLFYDENLSQNNTVACASCHLQEFAFTDPDVFSTGFLGGQTGRNSMSLVNVKYYNNGHFFWDERAATLEEQTLMPIQDAIEMGMTLADLEVKLNLIAYYPDLFEAAFGSPDISSERIAEALAQFVRSMLSYQSKFDVGIAQVADFDDPFPNFTPQENLGKDIFRGIGVQGNCNNCHTRNIQSDPNPNYAIFMDNQARNNGLDSALVNTDNGLGDVTGDTADNGKFKVPSLRNIGLTAPYMHDGRFATLEDVIDFYSNDVQAHPNLDNNLIVNNGPNAGNPRQPNFTQTQKDALVAFLHTLTDSTFMNDVRWSNPFTDGIVTIQANVLLQAPYDATSGTMSTYLLDNQLLSTTQPFVGSPWNYTGTECVEDATAFPVNTVDWILLEILDANDLNQVIEQQAAFVLADGTLVETDGSPGVRFYNLTENNSYYMVIRSRNHLAIMSEHSIVIPQQVSYDFTNPAHVASGNNQLAEVATNVYACLAGDFNGDGIVSVSDFNGYLFQSSLLNAYVAGDFNMDGTVSVQDFNYYLPNSSVIGVGPVRY